MRIQSLIIVIIAYLGYFCLLVCPLVENKKLEVCLESGIIQYEILKLRIEAQRGNSSYSADIIYNNQQYYLNIQKWEYLEAKKNNNINIYYCKDLDKIYTKSTIRVNKRVSLIAIFLVVFWTVMLIWVFIPYEKKRTR